MHTRSLEDLSVFPLSSQLTACRAMAAGTTSPSRLSAGRQVPINQPSQCLEAQLTPGCPQPCTSLHSPAHINNGTSCSWISLDWHPAFWPCQLPGIIYSHLLSPTPIPPAPVSALLALIPALATQPGHAPGFVPVRRLILEVRNSDSVAHVFVSSASMCSPG